MDVQACQQGIYVAENSRHRVARFDPAGELIGSWGERARKGLTGFQGCCNPMNVAFGPDGQVYTAESSTGRIKRYSPDGELLSIVGKVDLVPGCKKVSIAVSGDGSRVYMLDITRHHIVLMESVDVAGEPESSQPGDQQSAQSQKVRPRGEQAKEEQPSTAARAVVRGFAKLISSD